LAAYGKTPPRADAILVGVPPLPLHMELSMATPISISLATACVLLCLSCSTTTQETSTMSNETKAPVLRSAEMVSFLVTTDAARCRAFFEGKLGFRVVSDDSYALVLDAHGRHIRVQKMTKHEPRQYTVLGWNVRDIDAAIDELAAAGVKCEIFGTFKQNEKGVTDFPDGTRVAWFKDPDGNILSLAQMPR
jgi:catechol 2,3-dioxygenase-like lactoylglutathione lyase family enzyme